MHDSNERESLLAHITFYGIVAVLTLGLVWYAAQVVNLAAEKLAGVIA